MKDRFALLGYIELDDKTPQSEIRLDPLPCMDRPHTVTDCATDLRKAKK